MTSANYSDEVTRFLANVDDVGGSALDLDPTAPQVVFPGALTLDREQEDAMVDQAFRWIEDLSSTSGRDKAMLNDTHWAKTASLADLDNFFGRRRLYELMYHKRVDWRKNIPDSIFQKTNLHLPVVRRQVQQQIARATNYYFSTEPWFAATPQGLDDQVRGPKINRYAQWKFRQAGVRQAFESSLEKAFIHGESIIKTSSVRNSRFYEDILTYAVDPATGEPPYANDGDYIQESDILVAAINPETGEPEMGEDGAPVMVLERDKTTQIPAGDLTYVTGKVRREQVVYAGPEAKVIYYLDFLCPEDAESVQAAEFCCHLYDMPATQIAQAYLNRAEAAGPDDPARPRILELLRAAAGAHASELSAARGARAEDGPGQDYSSDLRQGDGMIAIAEVYLRMDVNGDGQPEDVMMILDIDTKKPLFYDYTDRVTPKGERPFHVVRVNPVAGRWYGNSQVDLFWDLQMYADLTWNRLNFSQSNAARVDFWNPAAVYEGDGNPHLQFNAGKSYRLKPGFTADDALQSKYLTDIKSADLQSQLEFTLQMATTLGGVSGPNDAAMAGLDTTKLATGIKNLEKGGQELFAPLLGHTEPGLSSASVALLRLLSANLDGPEVFQYFEGEITLDEIKPSDVSGLDFVVEMELTRYKNEQELQQSLAALDVIDRFYSESPEKQQLIAPIYRNILKLFGIDHADRLLQPGIYLPPAGAGGVDPNMAAQAIAPKPTGKSEPNL